jgi:hypothetical protein
MVRLTMALAASLFVITPAFAALAPRKAPVDFGAAAPHKLVKQTSESAKDDGDLVIDDDTEIKLDGKDIKYEDVPKDAQIILLDVSADRKIRKIHFRSKALK